MRDIVEVITIRRNGVANDFMEHGYQLLSIENVTEFQERDGHPGYVRKSFLYVLGRTREVERYVREARREPLSQEAMMPNGEDPNSTPPEEEKPTEGNGDETTSGNGDAPEGDAPAEG